MSGTEKKIVFKGDNQVSPGAQQMFRDIDAGIKKNSASLKEQNSLYLEQIRILKERASIQEAGVNKLFKEASSMSAGAEKAYKIGEYRDAKKAFEYDKKQLDQVIGLLGGILNENKKSTSSSANVEKEQRKKLKAADDQWQAKRSLWSQEARENPNLKRKIAEAERNGFAGMDPVQQEKLMYQKTLLPQEKKEQSTFAQVFAGTLAAGLIQQIARSLGQVVKSQTGEQAFNSLLGGIPIVGGILGGSSERNFEEEYAVTTKRASLRALTGSNVVNNGSGSFAERLAYSGSESLGLQEGLIKAAGSISGDKSTDSAMILQRGVGLSTETITQIVKDLRTTRSSSDVMQIAADVIKANPELRKDQTKFSEILQQTSTLTNQLASQSEDVDIRNNIGLVGALRSIGGSFADPVLGSQKMMSINQSLTNPGTEYQKARSFGVLSGTKPGMSYFETLEAQENGIGQKGYLSGVLKQLEREGGGGENFMLGIKENLGLGASSSRKLAEAYNKNPTMFDNFSGSKEDLDKILGVKRAEENVAQKDKDKAIVDNSYAISALDGTLSILNQTFKAFGDKLLLTLGAKDTKSETIKEFVRPSWATGENPVLAQ